MKKRLIIGIPIVLIWLVFAIALSVRIYHNKSSVNVKKDKNYDYEHFLKDFKKAGYGITNNNVTYNGNDYFVVEISFKKDDENKDSEDYELPLSLVEYSDLSLMAEDIEKAKLYASPDSTASYARAPHYFHNGKLIVCYLGYDNKIISDIEKILGKQFAGR